MTVLKGSFLPIFSLLLFFAPSTKASDPSESSAEWSFASAGLRIGSDFRSDRFTSFETFLYVGTPYRWEPSSWTINLKAEANAGALRSSSTSGALFSIGPALGFTHQKLPNLSVVLAGAPTFLSKKRYGKTDLGSNFQFTSSVSILYALSDRLSLAYRFQHISNGGIRSPNPGLDLHCFGALVKF